MDRCRPERVSERGCARCPSTGSGTALGRAPGATRGGGRRARLRGDLQAATTRTSTASAWRWSATRRTPRTRCRTRWSRCCEPARREAEDPAEALALPDRPQRVARNPAQAPRQRRAGARARAHGRRRRRDGRGTRAPASACSPTSSELPERQRAALVMRELSGLDFAEIGAAFGSSAAVARQTLYEARLSLRQLEAGREMRCADVMRELSDADGRVTRRRDIRAHLRDCADCRAFRDEISKRQEDLAALAPLPVAASAGATARPSRQGGRRQCGAWRAAAALPAPASPAKPLRRRRSSKQPRPSPWWPSSASRLPTAAA